MKFQNQVVLALGSNEGDRRSNIEAAIDRIHRGIGSVVRVSALYESPAWGFESADFYNAAVMVQTFSDAASVLSKCLSIESEMGRTRSADGSYSARVIDLDIISFNADVISTDALTVPHRFLADRLFVLLPMLDVLPDWKHPQTQLSVREMIASTTDASVCKRVGKLQEPMSEITIGRLNHLVIEGNIGAGKTTLSRKIGEDLNAKTVLERFADNPFLPKFYEDQSRYAFPLEMSFLADRYQQISDDLSQFDLFRDFIVADYHLYKSLIFAKITLSEDEFRLYRKVFDIMYREVPKPDLYVFLYQDTDRLLWNIKKRGRSYEQEIPAAYLENIQKGYLDFIRTLPQESVLVIDVSTMDFVERQEDYLKLLHLINEKANQVSA